MQYPISDPREIESYPKLVGEELFAKAMIIGTALEAHIKGIETYIRLGVTNVHILSSSPDESKPLEMYGIHIVPYFKQSTAR